MNTHPMANHGVTFLRWTGLLLALIAAVTAASGCYLVTLGGTSYFLWSGVAFCVSGVLLFLRHTRPGLQAYAFAFLATILWAVVDARLSLWGLLARLGFYLGFGLLFVALLLWSRRDHEAGIRSTMTLLLVPALLSVCLLCVAAVKDLNPSTAPYAVTTAQPYQPGSGSAQTAAEPGAGEWTEWGRDKAGTRFSPLDQINRSNVKNLEVAWTFHSGALPPKDAKHDPREFNFEATPLKIGDRLVFCTPHAEVIGLNPETGKQVWKFAPAADLHADAFLACRGVSYYEVPNRTGKCARRVLTATLDTKMYALDLETGERCEDFGQNGEISLLDGLGLVKPGYYYVSSPPAMVRGKAVVGGWVWDNKEVGEPSGVVRAFDAVTGKLAWAFDVGRLDRTTLPPPGETYTRQTPNVWTVMSADEKLGLVYLPTGNQTPDFYGAHRLPASEKFASSMIAVDAETGKLRWSFQTAHHDVWDFDLPAQGTLVDLKNIRPNEERTPAILVPTKQGLLFVLDRRDGTPLTKIEERPVPQHGEKGDVTAPTQPFPDIPSFGPPKLRESNMWGMTPLDQIYCRCMFKKSRYEGLYTPPSVQGSISYPGSLGVFEWGGISVDPETGRAITNNNWMPMRVTLVPRGKWQHQMAGFGGPEKGLPFAATALPLMSPLRIPCNQPPWGMMTAFDLNTRKVVWRRPFGTARNNGPLGIATHMPLLTGVPNSGGTVQTRGGLTFAGAAADATFRAMDTGTGEELWHATIPKSGVATPLTYMGSDGKQYVVIAAGGHAGMDNHPGDAMVAYRLP